MAASTVAVLRRRYQMRQRLWFLVQRYGPLEVIGTLTALLAAELVHVRGGPLATAAFIGSIAESLGYYGTAAIREYRQQSRLLSAGSAPSASVSKTFRRTFMSLLLEFGPAEALDSLLLRPWLMYWMAQYLHHFVFGLVAGKLVADLLFYCPVVISYLLKPRHLRASTTTGIPVAATPVFQSASEALHPQRLWELEVPTPTLALDVQVVEDRFAELQAALPGVNLHYAMKCNPHPAILERLDQLGCGFEIASYPELEALMLAGVDPAAVLFSNPVKPAEHIRQAFKAGVWRFAFDSHSELEKLARHAPGSAVYVRLQAPAAASDVPSEGKFGIKSDLARQLLQAAVRRGLEPYGLSFHVGSQMLRPAAYTAAMGVCADLMRQLEADDIRLRLLNIGGGFPARYEADIPPLSAYGQAINAGLKQLPYSVDVVAEPGRALVAQAGVMIAEVIGVAERPDGAWVTLDIGAFNGLMEALETDTQMAFPMVDSRQSSTTRPFHVTGPSCDSQDTIRHRVKLSAELQEGDRVLIGTTGAYTTVYASDFNGFRVPHVHCL